MKHCRRPLQHIIFLVSLALGLLCVSIRRERLVDYWGLGKRKGGDCNLEIRPLRQEGEKDVESKEREKEKVIA